MKRSEFNQNASGKLIQTSSGHLAFVPAPLPPQIRWSGELPALQSKADRSLAQLAQVGASFPAPHVVVYPFIRQEAVLSSRIEGTRTSLQELYVYEARQLSRIENADAHEVHNYVKTLEYGLDRLNTLPVSQRLIRELHARLMESVRGEFFTPGEFRRSQNWIGAPGATLETATYVPPPVVQMHTALSDLEKFIHQPSDIPPLIQTGLVHYQFEAIHPFLDGNGRVGRLLVSLLLCAWDLLPQPLLYLSAHFEAHRQQYYDHLLAVSQTGDWEGWLGFFLQGVYQQARESTTRLHRLEHVRGQYQELVAGERTRATLQEAIDYLIGQPITTVRQFQAGLGMSNYVTAQRNIAKLIELGILQQIGSQERDRTYGALEILQVIEGEIEIED